MAFINEIINERKKLLSKILIALLSYQNEIVNSQVFGSG